MTTLRTAMHRIGLLLIVFCLSACGGGSGTDPVDDGMPPLGPGEPEVGPPPQGEPYGTATDHILVEPLGLLPLNVLSSLGLTVIDEVVGTGFYKVQVPVGTTAVGLVSTLETSLLIATAELDLGLAAPEGDGRTIPAGGFLLSADMHNQPSLQRIGITQARSRGTGAGVTVAVLDSGIAPHPFLDGHIGHGGQDFFAGDEDPSEERNGVDDDRNGFIDEGYGHGTFVASLVLTVAPQATIVPYRVLGSDGFGSSSAVASAIMHASRLGVQVIQISIDMPSQVKVLRRAIQRAQDLGIAVIASAGNTGSEDVQADSDQPYYVTAVSDDDTRAGFSSVGAGVALSAPGVEIHGAYPWPDGRTEDTARWSGTSFSAPLVAGAFALLRQMQPGTDTQVLLDQIGATAVDVSSQNPGLDGKLGMGRLDLDAATGP